MDPQTIFIIAAISLVALLILFFIIRFALRRYTGGNRFILFLRFKVFRVKTKRKYDAYYTVKPRYLSQCELQYYDVLREIVGDKYFVFPQVPLSQIVEKHSSVNYKTELFRVIDFCIFDKEYFPLVCVEINDTTHLKKGRNNRDNKVADILKSARLPLVTLWTYEKINKRDIKKQLDRYLKL